MFVYLHIARTCLRHDFHIDEHQSRFIEATFRQIRFLRGKTICALKSTFICDYGFDAFDRISWHGRRLSYTYFVSVCRFHMTGWRCWWLGLVFFVAGRASHPGIAGETVAVRHMPLLHRPSDQMRQGYHRAQLSVRQHFILIKAITIYDMGLI